MQKSRQISHRRDKGVALKSVFQEIISECKTKTREYCDSVNGVLLDGFYKVVTNGICLHKYKEMGVSPRILPINYGKVFYSMKSSLRENIL